MIKGKKGKRGMRRKVIFLFMIFLCVGNEAAAVSKRCQKICYPKTGLHNAFDKLGYAIEDMLLLNVYLFSITSAKVLTSFTPFYLSARMIDEDIQKTFYDRICHTNIYQLPNTCHQVAQNGVGVPMVVLSTMALWAPDNELRKTARMFALGLPFVHWGKDLIKTLDTNICLRPWNEHFSSVKRSTGGFPSGHMANVTYMTALFGMRHGWKWAVPLSLFSAFVFTDFLNCNRHYLSQLIAGVGFGLLYAFSADAVIKRRSALDMQIKCGMTDQGGINASIACSF